MVPTLLPCPTSFLRNEHLCCFLLRAFHDLFLGPLPAVFYHGWFGDELLTCPVLNVLSQELRTFEYFQRVHCVSREMLPTVLTEVSTELAKGLKKKVSFLLDLLLRALHETTQSSIQALSNAQKGSRTNAQLLMTHLLAMLSSLSPL